MSWVRWRTARSRLRSPVAPVALLILAANGVIATLLPYATESFPLRMRGRVTGWLAACSKSGGLIAQLIGRLSLHWAALR
jgi:putative MFS transporter